MNNPGITVLSDNGMVRGFFLNSKELANQAFQYHQTAPVVTAGLGRLLTAAVMMGKTLKNEQDLLTLQIEGSGPVKTLLATAGKDGCVKGFPGNAIVELPLKPNGKLDVGGAVGNGFLTVLRDNGGGEPYASQTALVSGEIAEDITNYYAASEQIPTVCALGVLVDRNYTVRSSGGFLVQLLPGADEDTITRLEENMRTVTNVSALFEHTSNEKIAEMVYAGIPFHITEQWNAVYRCNCSRARTEKVLISLGRDVLTEFIQEKRPITLNCSFCDRSYTFTVDEVSALLRSAAEK